MTHFNIRPEVVRCEIFKEQGKWYETVAFNMEGLYDVPLMHDAILNRFVKTIGGHHGMWIVILEPYHVNAHPVMLRVP